MPDALTLRDAGHMPAESEPSQGKRRSSPRDLTTPILAAVAVLGLSVTLVVTIYFTQLEIQWVTFLLGVLFAAIVAMVTMTVRAQWLLAQSTAEVERQKERLAEEAARGERQAQALKMADARFRTVLDGVPAAVFFVDREERCRFHNAAFETWCGRAAADIAGFMLKELVDDAVYRDLGSRGADALLGRETQFEASWRDGESAAVRLLPYPVGAQTPSGFYAFVTIDRREAGPVEIALPEVASETAYLDTMEQQLDAGGKAREHLLRALEEDRFILLEQRIEALVPEGQPNLREILLRLQEDTERTLPPADFFEIAGRYDLMPAIDRWVIRRLLKCCAAMKQAERGWRMPLYCVNVSGATLRDRGFANHVRAQLQHWDIPGSRLCFEIHHGVFAEQQADIASLMAQLKPLGCRFTVDGFGSHKVSFAPFRELHFDYLKIDGSIVSQVLRSASELTKVKALVVACDKIGVQTIAQFVEDDATRTALQEAGVDYVQGFGIEKPGPLAVVATMAPAV